MVDRMIAADAVPIHNIPARKRIDLNARQAATVEALPPYIPLQAAVAAKLQSDHIWNITKQMVESI